MESLQTSTLKPKTTTVYIGQTDKEEYIICRKCGYFHLRKDFCKECIKNEKQEKLRKEQLKKAKLKKREKKIAKEAAEKEKKKEIREAKKKARFYTLWKHCQSVIEGMIPRKNALVGTTFIVIRHVVLKDILIFDIWNGVGRY